jgi:hypothetical protein
MEIVVEGLSNARLGTLGLGHVETRGNRKVISLPQDGDITEAVTRIAGANGRVIEVSPVRQTLEDYFMNRVAGTSLPRPAAGIRGKQLQTQAAGGSSSEDNRFSKEHV